MTFGMWTRRELLSGALKTGAYTSVRHALPAQIGAQSGATGYPSQNEILNRPWVYWFWLNGNITPEGITHDLESMASIGISGAIILSSHVGEKGPYQYSTSQWFDIVQHTIREAQRLGMALHFNNGDGWADASGPWVPLEESMQKLVWTEMRLDATSTRPIHLPEPENFQGSYRDIAFLAFPTPANNGALPSPLQITPQRGSPSFVVHDYGQAVTVRSAQIRLWADKEVPILTPVLWSLEASVDGTAYEEIYRFDNHWRFCDQKVDRFLHLSCRFKPHTARYFRLCIPYQQKLANDLPTNGRLNPEQSNHFTLSSDDLIAQWEMKGGHFDNSGGALEQPSRYSGGFRNLFAEFGTPQPQPEPGSILRQQDLVDITAHFANGALDWGPPSGNWTVLRVGYTAIGRKNNIATATGRGYYVDRFNADAMDHHFSHLAQKVIDQNRKEAGHGLAGFHMDSSECGPQNWGPRFAEEFQKRRGYSIVPWLPALAGGHIVHSLEASERFLWDFRRTIADLFADCWWGRLADLCHRNELTLTGEGAGRMAFMLDPLLHLSKADFPMGEFWVGEIDVRPDCSLSRSTANTYGKKAVFGESFTSATWIDSPYAGAWQDHPWSLKKLGDHAFVSGINHFVFHRSISQPTDDRPGTALPRIGINMERSNTWWNSGGKAWNGYLQHCQNLLQSGREIVDVCVLMDEDVPNYLLPPEDLPPGYRFDGLHSQLLEHATVDDGDLLLPSGMRYKLLVLPESTLLRPQTMRHVARLIEGGLAVVGNRPTRSPSLQDYPDCDREVATLVDRCWKSKNVHASLRAALAALQLRPDFVFHTDADIRCMHRRNQRGDFYFVSNQTDSDLRCKASVRIGNAIPLLLDPDTKEERTPAQFTSQSETTSVDLHLLPRESLFLFMLPGKTDESISAINVATGTAPEFTMQKGGSIAAVALSSASVRLTSSRNRHAALTFAVKKPVLLNSGWTVSFPQDLGAPASIELPDLISLDQVHEEGARHFSGTATYRTMFDLSTTVSETDELAFLDLGSVGVVAQVTINGAALRTTWKPPFRYDVTHLLRKGKNTLVIQVTNLWANRLIGDSALPPEKRIAKTNYNPYKPDTPLPLSGLKGPVAIIFGQRKIVTFG